MVGKTSDDTATISIPVIGYLNIVVEMRNVSYSLRQCDHFFLVSGNLKLALGGVALLMEVHYWGVDFDSKTLMLSPFCYLCFLLWNKNVIPQILLLMPRLLLAVILPHDNRLLSLCNYKENKHFHKLFAVIVFYDNNEK